MITNGLSVNQISQKLNVSDNSVRTYKARIMRKLHIDNMPSLVKFALRHELTSLN